MPDLHLYSDASCSGWGAHLLDQHVSGVWSDQKLLHINLLEMKALFLGLQSFRDVIGHHVTAMCDNSTVVAYINKQGGTVSRALCLLASRLLRWTESLDIHLDARYLPGQASVLADLLSRRGQVVGTEWSLHPQVARSLLCVWGNLSMPFCAVPQRETAPLLLARPGSPGRLRGCVSSSLGRPGPVRVPSISSGRSGDRPCPGVIASHDDWSYPSGQRRPSFSTDPITSHPALVGQSALAASLQPLPPRRPRVEPSRVATLKLFGKGCWSLFRVSQILHLAPLLVVMADLLWLVSWKGRCSSQRHCFSSRGLSNTLTPRQGFVRLCG